MNNALKKGFPLFRNEQSLKSAIKSVCAEFGRVTYLNILPAYRNMLSVGRQTKLQCDCFLRLDSAAAEAKLKSKLLVIGFADDLHFFADVDEGWTGPTMRA